MTFSNWSYSKKSKYLIVGVFILLLMSYMFSIKKTIDVYRSNNDLQLRLTHAKAASEEIHKIRIQSKDLNNIIISNNSPEEFQLKIFSIVSIACDSFDVKLLSLERNSPIVEKDISLENLRVTLNSDYKSLVKVVNYLETTMAVGNISSIKYELVKNRVSRREELVMSLFIQGVLKTQ